MWTSQKSVRVSILLMYRKMLISAVLKFETSANYGAVVRDPTATPPRPTGWEPLLSEVAEPFLGGPHPTFNPISIGYIVKFNCLMKKLLQNFISILSILFLTHYLLFRSEFDRIHNCVANCFMHSLSPCYGLLTTLVFLNSVARWFIQHIFFFQKWCNLACLCAWAAEGFFPGVHRWIFSKVFLNG